MKHLWQITFLLISMSFALRSFSYDPSYPSKEPPQLDEEFYCRVARELASNYERGDFSCNDGGDSDFLFYHVKRVQGGEGRVQDKPSSIQIASFNLLHLGDDVGQLKDLTLVAEVMNLWDVVVASELKSLPVTGKIQNHNQHALEQPRAWSSRFSKLILPVYYQLLVALRELDSSWSLVLTTVPQGDGPYRELTGFYLRSSRVKLVEDRAKLVDIDPHYRSLLFRTPSQIFLQSGSFQFSVVATHIRYTVPPDDVKRKNAMALAKEILSRDSPKEVKYLPFLKRADYQLRFAELKTILTSLFERTSKSGNRKVILAGDLNLDSSGKRLALQHHPEVKGTVEIEALWEELLSRFGSIKLFVDQPTTISEKSGRSSSLDHFIADPDEIEECDFSGSEAWDFSSLFFESESRQEQEKKSPRVHRVQSMIAQAVGDLRRQGASYFLSEGRSHRSFYGLTLDRIGELSESSPALAEEFSRDSLKEKVEERVVSLLRAKPGSSDYHRRFRAVYQVLSDHLPIVVKCWVDGRAPHQLQW